MGNSFITSLWGASADPALHSIHFGYMIGSTLTPILTAPFVSLDEDTDNSTTWNTSATPPEGNHLTTVAQEGQFDDDSRIEIPYAIAGLVTLAMSAVFWVFFCVGPPKALTFHSPKKTTFKEVFSPGSCAGGRSGLGTVFVSLSVAYYVVETAQGSGFWSLNYTYAVDSDLGFDKQEASVMSFTQRICGMVARALIVPISRWVPAPVILFTSVISSTVLMSLLALVGTRDKTMYWVFTCAYTLLSSPTWGAAYAFIDKYIVLYAFVVALTAVGAGLSGFAFQALNGYLYEHTVMESMYYLAMALTLVWTALIVIMQVVARQLGNRHQGKNARGEEEEEEEEKVVEQTSQEKLVTKF